MPWEWLAMSISREQAADFGQVNTLSDAVSAQHAQQMDLWSSQTQQSTDNLSNELNEQMAQVQAAADEVQKSSQSLSVQAEQTVASAEQFQELPNQEANVQQKHLVACELS